MPAKTVDLYKVPHRPPFKGSGCDVWEDGSCGSCWQCLFQRLKAAEAYITVIRGQYRRLLSDIGERKTQGDYERC
jgi:hypothetical protein